MGQTFDSVVLENSNKVPRIQLNGAEGSIICTSNAWVAVYLIDGNTGELTLQGINPPGHSLPRIRFEPGGANIWLGGNGQDGSLFLFRKDGDNKTIDNCTIRLDAASGDINLNNADCAEDFDIAETEGAVPGAVMVIDEGGKLRPSREAYDKRVAGVLSGAGDFKPGIVLDKKQTGGDRLPVALVGKVYCHADAQFSAIEVGDLLTTSATPGHAMKATDPLRAFGAVIGKALRPLQSGRGLIPILIALQ